MKEPNIYVWCNKKQIYKYMEFFVGRHSCLFEIIVWNKSDALPTYSNKYLTDCEYCLYFHKGLGKVKPRNYEDAKTVLLGKIYRDKDGYNHPSIKPLSFMRKFIRNSSKPGDVVFDPFLGSGTTAEACVLEGRNCIGIEIDEKHYITSCSRVENCERGVFDV